MHNQARAFPHAMLSTKPVEPVDLPGTGTNWKHRLHGEMHARCVRQAPQEGSALGSRAVGEVDPAAAARRARNVRPQRGEARRQRSKVRLRVGVAAARVDLGIVACRRTLLPRGGPAPSVSVIGLRAGFGACLSGIRPRAWQRWRQGYGPMLARASSRVTGALGSALRRCAAAFTGLADGGARGPVPGTGLRGARAARSAGLTLSVRCGCSCAGGPAERLLRERRCSLQLRLELPQLQCTQRL